LEVFVEVRLFATVRCQEKNQFVLDLLLLGLISLRHLLRLGLRPGDAPSHFAWHTQKL